MSDLIPNPEYDELAKTGTLVGVFQAGDGTIIGEIYIPKGACPPVDDIWRSKTEDLGDTQTRP